jgi:hypothetical protein
MELVTSEIRLGLEDRIGVVELQGVVGFGVPGIGSSYS